MNSLNHQALALAEKFGLNIKGDELITALKNTAFKTKDEISDEQMMSLLIVANQHNLNPWTKEIYAF
ncbi:recombinase, partial [Wohlfahrtiimonas chitiniclastica]